MAFLLRNLLFLNDFYHFKNGHHLLQLG